MATLNVTQEIETQLIDMVARAGSAILDIYETDFDVRNKDDKSPVTQADLSAHQIIVAALQSATPQVPIVSEESTPPPYAQRATWPSYWLVDPLDGTKEFVNRNGEFTVNIALIEGHRAVYAANRARLLEALPGMGFQDIAPADGAFYIYADISAFSNDSKAFSARLLSEAGVAATTGLDFDPGRGHRTLRFSFARTEAEIIEGIARLGRFLNG